MKLKIDCLEKIAKYFDPKYAKVESTKSDAKKNESLV